MGSLNDLVLQRSYGCGAESLANGADNDRFDKLGSEIYIRARKLKSEEF